MNAKDEPKLRDINARLDTIRLKLDELGDDISDAARKFYVGEITLLKYELDEIEGGEKASFRLVQAIKSLERI